MKIKVAFIIDPIDRIKAYKDSSVAMMLEAQRRGWEVYVLQPWDLKWTQGRIEGQVSRIQVHDQADWAHIIAQSTLPMASMNAVFMRKDPPMDMHYIYTTYLLELLQKEGVVVINDPRSLRDVNEKLYTAWFPQCCVETYVGARMEDLHAFLNQHRDIIVKPLGSMGGASIFRVKHGDPNTNVIFETLTEHGRILTMAQRFIPDIVKGDKRLILVDGEAIPYALARIPKEGETRGNLAAGARGEGLPLSDRDRWLCDQVGPELKARGLTFVGLDVIGDYITEINVTSPTGIRELDAMFQINISARLMDEVQSRIVTT